MAAHSVMYGRLFIGRLIIFSPLYDLIGENVRIEPARQWRVALLFQRIAMYIGIYEEGGTPR